MSLSRTCRHGRGEGREKIYEHERLLKTRNRHLDHQTLANLLSEKRIMEPVFDIIEPSISLWRTQIFDMNGRQGLGWRTDEYRAILAPIDKQVSAQVAFFPSSEQNCVWVLAGSHRLNDSEISNRFNLDYIEDRDEARLHAEELVDTEGLRFAHSANEPDLINGVGTYTLEIYEEFPGLDVIVLPLGAAAVCVEQSRFSGR